MHVNKQENLIPKKCSRETLGDGGRKVGNVGKAKGWEVNAAGCVCSSCRRFPLIVLQAEGLKSDPRKFPEP